MPEAEGSTHAAARPRDVAPAQQRAPGMAGGSPRPGYVDALLSLQATAGNQAVVRLLHEGLDPPPGVDVLATGAWKFGRHPQFPASMGQTWYAHNDIEIWPQFNLEYSRSFIPPFPIQARPKTTDAAGAAWPVLATPENEEGYKMPESHPEHPGLDYYIRVSGVAANTIAGAEQQHVNDLDEGWDLTGRSAKKAINAAAGEDWSEGDDQAAAKAAAIDKVVGKMGGLGPKVKSTLDGGGSLEPAIGPMMDKSFVQSKSKRDASGKHTIPVVYVTTSADGTKVLYEADPDKALDTTATSDVVNLGSIS